MAQASGVRGEPDVVGGWLVVAGADEGDDPLPVFDGYQYSGFDVVGAGRVGHDVDFRKFIPGSI